MEGVAIYENGEQGGVNFGIVSDFTHLVIGEIGGVLLFLGSHNCHGPA